MFAAACARVQFHLPKTLATALCVEAAELLEQFQWLAQAASATRTPIKRLQVGEEMADVLSYRIRLAGRLEIDLADAARRTVRIDARRDPIAKVRGSRRKYTDL